MKKSKRRGNNLGRRNKTMTNGKDDIRTLLRSNISICCKNFRSAPLKFVSPTSCHLNLTVFQIHCWRAVSQPQYILAGIPCQSRPNDLINYRILSAVNVEMICQQFFQDNSLFKGTVRFSHFFGIIQ